MHQLGNDMWNLGEEYKLEKGQRYTIRDIAERQAQTIFGKGFGYDNYFAHSSEDLRDKSIEESFPRVFLPSRVPIYLEYFLGHKQDVKEIIDQLGIEWDFTPYSPVPIWIPCEAHTHDGEYSLLATNCKVPTHQFSTTTENIWIDEIAGESPYTYSVMMHTSAAAARGLKTGDTVCVASKYGQYTGRLKETELLHPESVICCGTFGHWAKGLPVSRSKGVLHNALLPKPSIERIDMLSGQIDMCVGVKVYKV